MKNETKPMTKKEIKAELAKAGIRAGELNGCCYLGFCGPERKRLAHLGERKGA